MNKLRLLSPDFVTGKVLVATKSLLDILVLLMSHPSRQSLRFARIILRVKPRFTMVTNGNLLNLFNLVKEANRLDLHGDIVECGVWNGGSAAIMWFANAHCPSNSCSRTIWLFDSFQGLPRPGEKDGNWERTVYFEGWNQGDVEKVKQAFRTLGLGLDNVIIVPGWFESTLATAPVSAISVLHIDADWYDSVKTALTTLYDKVVPGGFVVLDDYGYWQGCRKALEDFLVERGIYSIEIVRIDRVGGYFRKPLERVANQYTVKR